MHTLTLVEAGKFLKMHPEELRRRAKAGLMPGAKIGKCWVFIEEDLAEFVRSRYAEPRQALQVQPMEKSIWHSTDVEKHGGLTSSLQAASALDALLEPKTKKPLKNSTTN